MAEMVWCESCKTVVWAYDHQPSVDLRGICNMLKLPCPKCGTLGDFDGWSDRGTNFQELKERILEHHPQAKIYDWWSMMKHIAEYYKRVWEPSPKNTWFDRPDGTNWWKRYQRVWETQLDKPV